MEIYEEISKNFKTIEELFTKEELSEFLNSDKDKLFLYHFGLGIWIRNNLIYGKEELIKMFNERHVYHVDDMSGFIIREFHSWLKDKI